MWALKSNRTNYHRVVKNKVYLGYQTPSCEKHTIFSKKFVKYKNGLIYAYDIKYIIMNIYKQSTITIILVFRKKKKKKCAAPST